MAGWIIVAVVSSPTILLSSMLCFLLLIFLIKRSTTFGDKRLPPGSFGWPFVGETADFVVDGKKFMKTRTEKYGPIFKTSILGSPTVVVSGAENVQPILQGENKLVTHNLPTSALTLFGPHALCNSVGEHHHLLRKSISRTFEPWMLSEVTPLVHEVIREYIDKWRSQGSVSSGVNEFKHLSFAMATRVLLPLHFNDPESKVVRKLFDTFNDAFFSFPFEVPGLAFRKGMQAQRRLKELITNRVMELVSMQHDIKISMLLRVLKCCSDIRQHYKELPKFDEVNLETDDPKEVSDEFQDLSLEFVYASFQTISSSLCAIAICLGQHPEVVQNISDELESLDIGAKSDSAHSITHANVMSATYTNYVMKEVMRLYPPIAGAFRTTLEPMEIMGYHIPKGWSLLYTIPTTHFLANNRVYEESMADFKPERWQQDKYDELDDSEESDATSTCRKTRTRKEKFEYIPFGAGARGCIGKEFAKLIMRVFIIELVRTGNFRLANGPSTPDMITAPLPFPKDGMPLIFETTKY